MLPCHPPHPSTFPQRNRFLAADAEARFARTQRRALGGAKARDGGARERPARAEDVIRLYDALTANGARRKRRQEAAGCWAEGRGLRAEGAPALRPLPAVAPRNAAAARAPTAVHHARPAHDPLPLTPAVLELADPAAAHAPTAVQQCRTLTTPPSCSSLPQCWS